MAEEKSNEAFYDADASKVIVGDSTTFSDSTSTAKAAKCVRWLLLILPTVISVVALVAIIIAVSVFSSMNNAQSQVNEQTTLLQRRVAELEAAVNSSNRNDGNSNQNSQFQRTYTRWGNSTCPDVSGTTLLYSGYTGGTSYFNSGGGANQICMPTDPQYTLPFEPGIQAFSQVYGSEYESVYLGTANENVPCAVCLVSDRSEILMIPAKTTCPPSWTTEYFGYLMSENHGNSRTTFICVDVGMEFIPFRGGHQDACDLWTIEINCVSMPCPPYDPEKELVCAVCSK